MQDSAGGPHSAVSLRLNHGEWFSDSGSSRQLLRLVLTSRASWLSLLLVHTVQSSTRSSPHLNIRVLPYRYSGWALSNHRGSRICLEGSETCQTWSYPNLLLPATFTSPGGLTVAVPSPALHSRTITTSRHFLSLSWILIFPRCSSALSLSESHIFCCTG